MSEANIQGALEPMEELMDIEDALLQYDYLVVRCCSSLCSSV